MQELDLNFAAIKEQSVQGRYVTNDHIRPYMETIRNVFKVETIGYSELKKPIELITIGTGKKKILMWSQMHGNESTTTKALLDFMNWLQQSSTEANTILEKTTLYIIPILNPDGAKFYTRLNANKVDLNRDAQELTQLESNVLRDIYKKIQPDFCYNLHGQRTIFNVGDTNKPATISFLAPSYDKERNVSDSRYKSMQVIAAMNATLQKEIPGQIGRYDDGFNPNCVGDYFQMQKVPTILFEAGHNYNDYERETTRQHIFTALVSGTLSIASTTYTLYSKEDYLSIPDNNKLFFDILVHNADVLDASLEKGVSVGILYKEVLGDKGIKFVPYIADKGELDIFFGHKEFDVKIQEDLEQFKEENIDFNSLLSC